MSADLSERVMQMIADQTGFRRSGMRPDTDLARDLGVDGDDARELLLRFGGDFNVNLVNLQFDRHFGPEAGFNLLALLRPSRWRWQSERVPLTIADLVEAARTRSWPIGYDEERRSPRSRRSTP
jgi:uncharacterized protein DUF1493